MCRGGKALVFIARNEDAQDAFKESRVEGPEHGLLCSARGEPNG